MCTSGTKKTHRYHHLSPKIVTGSDSGKKIFYPPISDETKFAEHLEAIWLQFFGPMMGPWVQLQPILITVMIFYPITTESLHILSSLFSSSLRGRSRSLWESYCRRRCGRTTPIPMDSRVAIQWS